MNDSEYIFAEVNKLLEQHKQSVAINYENNWKNLQKYVGETLQPVLKQSAEIDAKNQEHWVASEVKNAARFESENRRLIEVQKHHTANIRTQNACMLVAAGYTVEIAVDAVMKIENMFKDKP